MAVSSGVELQASGPVVIFEKRVAVCVRDWCAGSHTPN